MTLQAMFHGVVVKCALSLDEAESPRKGRGKNPRKQKKAGKHAATMLVLIGHGKTFHWVRLKPLKPASLH